jgi:hypothetical protein
MHERMVEREPKLALVCFDQWAVRELKKLLKINQQLSTRYNVAIRLEQTKLYLCTSLLPEL